MADNKNTSKKSTTSKKTNQAVVKKTTPKSAPKKPTTTKSETKTVKTPVVEKKVAEKKVPVKKVTEEKVIEKKVTEKKESVKKENVKKVETKFDFSTFVRTNSRNLILGAICVLLIINIILVTIGHQVKLVDGKEIIASIDGKTYTAEQVFESLKEKYGSTSLLNLIDSYINDKELTEEDMKKAKEDANEYVAGIKSQYESSGYEWDAVLAQYGYNSENDLVNEYLTSVKSELVAKKYIKDALTEKEIKDYYENNIYGNYTVKHILIKPVTTTEMTEEETAAAEATAKTKAEEVIAKYANGEDWASLVTTYSEDDGSKETEGLIENFTNGDMDEEFFKASVALKDGEYTKEPIKSAYGYHIIVRVSATKKPTFEDKKEDVMDTLVDKKLEEDSKLYTATWVKIRNKYKLSINDTAIKKAYEKTISE